jgi:hypothetical protein
MADRQRLSDDDRYERAMAAAASERRNRPKNLILFPVALFMIASLVLAYALFRVESGRVYLENQQVRYDRLVDQVVRIKELEQQSSEAGAASLEPITDFLSRAEGYAREAGLEPVPLVPTPRTDRSRGLVRVRYVYTGVTNRSLETLLAWVRLTVDGVEGLFVPSVSLKPAGEKGWTMEVTFARWERGGSP